MGMFDFIGKAKDKVKDVTMEKVLEKMRDLKMSASQKQVNKMIDACVENIDNIKSAKVAINRSELVIKAVYNDDTPIFKCKLKFVELVWTSHKRSFVFEAEEPFDYKNEYGGYVCVVATLATILQQMLGMKKDMIAEAGFSHHVGPISGVLEKNSKLFYDVKRIPLLRQYANYRMMGQAPMDHLNVTDCWLENGKAIVRIDNNRIVDQIKSMNLNPADLRKMMQGEIGDTEKQKAD